MNKPSDIVCSEPALKYMLVLRQVLPFCAISLFGQWGLGHQRFHWQPLQNAKQFKSLLSPTATSGGTWLEDLLTNRLRWGQRAVGDHVRGPHWGADLQPGHWHWHQEEVLHNTRWRQENLHHLRAAAGSEGGDLQLGEGVGDAHRVLPPMRLATSSFSAQRTTPPARRSWCSRWTLWRPPREQMPGWHCWVPGCEHRWPSSPGFWGVQVCFGRSLLYHRLPLEGGGLFIQLQQALEAVTHNSRAVVLSIATHVKCPSFACVHLCQLVTATIVNLGLG